MKRGAKNLIAQIALAALFFSGSFCRAYATVSGDEHWDKQFGAVGSSDQLYSVATVGGKIYVGGMFFSAGQSPYQAVAGFDGTNWSSLNGGVTGGFATTSYIFSLASDGTNLYVGGVFTNADNSGAYGIGRWDGSNWWPLAGGAPNGVVETIKIFGTNIFVGGSFTSNGTTQVNGIARWDGSKWNPFGLGVSSGSQPVVLAIEYDGTNIYAGGTFTQAGLVNATNIAQWNGSSWSAMGNVFPTTVSTLARLGGYLYAGGGFTNASLGITNLAKWDGNTWTSVGTGANAIVRSLLSDGVNLYAGGDFTQINGIAANHIAKWNGVTWSPLAAGMQGFGEGANQTVASMTFDTSGRLIAAGNFNQVNGVGVSHVAAWDGTNWFPLGGNTSKGLSHFIGQVKTLYSDGVNLYAGGVFTEAGDVIVNGTAQWNGTNWSALGSVVNGQQPILQTEAFVSAGGYLFAGGNFTNIGGIVAKYVAEWNGTTWNNIGNADSAVRALVYDGNYVWAGGLFTNIGGISSLGLAAYQIGVGWNSFGPIAGGSHLVNALAWDGTTLYAGGNFTSINGVSANNIARFNGSIWSPLSTGVNNTVDAIAVSNGVVYVGGNFTTAGGGSVNSIAKWNGTGWSTLGSGLTGSLPAVNAIVISGTNLYVGGSFTNSGSLSLPGIAKWNGSSWTNLGSGLYNTISSQAGTVSGMAALGNDIYLGGFFTFAGTKPAIFIARWNDQLNFYPPPAPLLSLQKLLTNGQFQFRLTGTSGQSYILQGSTNLTTWTPLVTNTAMFYDYIDTKATNSSAKFYRAILGP